MSIGRSNYLESFKFILETYHFWVPPKADPEVRRAWGSLFGDSRKPTGWSGQRERRKEEN